MKKNRSCRALQGKIRDVTNRNKLAIFFFICIIELVRQLVISSMLNIFEQDS